MNISVVRCKRNFHNLTVKHKQMHLLDEPHNLSAAFAKNNLAHQMRYSIELLEATLRSNGTPHVLQLKLEGEDKQNPSSWTLYADGERVAHGTGEFARVLPQKCSRVSRYLPRCHQLCQPSLLERTRLPAALRGA